MRPYSLSLQPARTIRGAIRVPGDKSISHRYAMLSALADGTTEITDLAPGADVAATVRMLQRLGIGVETIAPGHLRVRGTGLGRLQEPAGPLDAANSGTTMRLMAGVLAGAPFTATLEGDASLERRPMQRVIDPLTAMGADIASHDGRPPLTIRGTRLHSVEWRLNVPSAQVKSAILIAALGASGTTRVEEPVATRDHTERAFPVFGLAMGAEGRWLTVAGGQRPFAPSHTLRVPGDPSSAAVWACAAAAMPGSSVAIQGVSLNPRRIAFLEVLRRMGAEIEIEVDDDRSGEPVGTIHVAHGDHRPTAIDPAEVAGVIDELPALAARATFGGGLEVGGAGELRVKESDRITALVTGLRALGADAEERHDGFVVQGGAPLSGGRADAAGDHRLVMTFALVALGATGPSEIAGADAVAVSYPDFARDLARLAS